MIGVFQYRDASNYKFEFKAEIPKGMRIGDETMFENLGFTQEKFFGEGNIVPYPFDEDEDHNIVELTEIVSINDHLKKIVDELVGKHGINWTISRAQRLNDTNHNLLMGSITIKEWHEHYKNIIVNKIALDYLYQQMLSLKDGK